MMEIVFFMNTPVNELLEKVRENDSTAFDLLLESYAGLLKNSVSAFVGEQTTREDIEDMEQEAKMSLLRAARTYNFDSGLTFGLYAKICIKNGLVSLERKRRSLPVMSDVDIEDMELSVPDTTLMVDESDSAKVLLEKIRRFLSKTEFEVLSCRLEGLNRAEIAGKLGIDVKSVDNAVVRIKQKLKTVLS